MKQWFEETDIVDFLSWWVDSEFETNVAKIFHWCVCMCMCVCMCLWEEDTKIREVPWERKRKKKQSELRQGQEYVVFPVVDVQLPSSVWLFATPRKTARQSSLSLTISRSLPKFLSIASVMNEGKLPMPRI